MGNKKKNRRGTGQDKRLQQAYQEMMEGIRKKVEIRVEDVSDTPEICKTDNSEKSKNTKRLRIKPAKALEVVSQKQNELKMRKRTFFAPVTRVLPFQSNKQRYQFRDFRKNEEPITVLPQGLPKAPSRANLPASLSPTLINEIVSIMDDTSVSSKETKPKSIEDVLLVMPLRLSPAEETKEKNPSNSRANLIRFHGQCTPQLPPIYRREFWKENIANREPSRSIPSRNDGKFQSQLVSLMVNNQAVWVAGKEEVVRRCTRRSLTGIRLQLNASKNRQLAS